jgi:hypothetical protein
MPSTGAMRASSASEEKKVIVDGARSGSVEERFAELRKYNKEGYLVVVKWAQIEANAGCISCKE